MVEPGHQAGVAEVIAAAARLDDDGLRTFLESFAARVRASPVLVTQEELQRLLQASMEDGSAGAP